MSDERAFDERSESWKWGVDFSPSENNITVGVTFFTVLPPLLFFVTNNMEDGRCPMDNDGGILYSPVTFAVTLSN